MTEKEIFDQFINETGIPRKNVIDYRYCTKFYAGLYIENAIIIQFKKGLYDFEHLVYKVSNK